MKFLCLLCVFCLIPSLTPGTHIRINNNGYELVVVAIHDSVKENAQMLTALKKIISDSSKVLYESTRHRAFFRKVFFLIPSTWSSSLADKDSTSVTLRDADVILSDPASVSRRSSPRTRSYAGCGHSGIHIQLRTDVLLNNNHPLIQHKPEKYIVHEFAKYWYGVFEEYPNPGENQFYFSTTFGRADPVRCSIGLIGRIMQKTSSGIQLCGYDSVDPETGEFPEGCVYYPYPSHNRGTASMMDHSYIQEIQDFCDDDHTQGHYSHNVEPPNRHNRLCSHRSTWDVISNTPDFQGNANPPTTLSDSQLAPQFIIFRAPSRRRRRLAVILDSPKEFHKRLRLHQAVDHFLGDGFDDDTKVAIIHDDVTNGRGTRMRGRRSATVKSSLQNLHDSVDPSALPSRIRAGIEVLKKNNSTKEGMEFHLILISCNNQTVLEEGNIQKMVDFGITPHFYNCEENRMKNIEETIKQQGGLVEIKSHRSIFSALQRLSEKLHGDEKNLSVQLVNENLELAGEGTHQTYLPVDESLHGELVVRLHYTTAPPSVSVIAPNGSACGYTATNHKLRYIKISSFVTENEHGKWSVAITNKTPYHESIHLLVVLKSQSTEDEVPIRTNAWVKVFHEHSPPRVGVYAEVMYGGHPVVNANVSAHVYHRERKVASLALRDTGGGFDIMKHDGIYSNSFTEMDAHGIHYVEVTVKDSLNNLEIHKTYEIPIPTEQDKGKVTDNEGEPGHVPMPDYHTERVRLKHGLRRSTSTGQFHIDQRWDLVGNPDPYPPVRVIDLQIDGVDRKERRVTLSWTAPGSNLDTGTASSYEIRYQTNGTALVHEPTAAWLVTDDMIVGTSGGPRGAGQTEHVTVQFPPSLKWVAVMLRAVDENNNKGEFSNMMTTFFEL
ncbi:calcium-activated chloride channel regulator 1-like isoform X1 [Crassostrea virginica]